MTTNDDTRTEVDSPTLETRVRLKKTKCGGVELHWTEVAGMTPWSILKALGDNDAACLSIYRIGGRLVITNVGVQPFLAKSEPSS